MKLTVDKVFYVYMAVVGLATGGVLARYPQVHDIALKPYFWIMIAIALFDGAVFLMSRHAPWEMLTTNARLIGFGIGIALMVLLPWLAGTSVGFL